MQLTTTLAVLIAVSTPAVAKTLSTSAGTEWTLTSLSRNCNKGDTSCTWLFGIDTNEADVGATTCNYTVKATTSPPTPASQANGGPAKCGVFNITSGWSGQFGPDQGFTVISVVDYTKKLIAYAGYTDASIFNGTVVDPDLSFPVQTLQ